LKTSNICATVMRAAAGTSVQAAPLDLFLPWSSFTVACGAWAIGLQDTGRL
jgi:hypothetical protein